MRNDCLWDLQLFITYIKLHVFGPNSVKRLNFELKKLVGTNIYETKKKEKMFHFFFLLIHWITRGQRQSQIVCF